MNKLNVNNLDKNDPVQSMFLQLLMIARMSGSEKKLVGDLFERQQSGRPLTGPQTSLLTSIYLKYHDKADAPKKEKAQVPTVSVAAQQTDKGKWTKFLSK